MSLFLMKIYVNYFIYVLVMLKEFGKTLVQYKLKSFFSKNVVNNVDRSNLRAPLKWPVQKQTHGTAQNTQNNNTNKHLK